MFTALLIAASLFVPTFSPAPVVAVVEAGQGQGDVLPCVTEDAPGPCYWDATVRGNGLGDSFTVAADGTVTYWED